MGEPFGMGELEPLQNLQRRDRLLSVEPSVNLVSTVDEDRTGAALGRIAPHVRTGEVQLFAQEVDEERSRLDDSLAGFAIDSDRDGDHVSVRFGARRERRYVESGVSRTVASPLSA